MTTAELVIELLSQFYNKKFTKTTVFCYFGNLPSDNTAPITNIDLVFKTLQEDLIIKKDNNLYTIKPDQDLKYFVQTIVENNIIFAINSNAAFYIQNYILKIVKNNKINVKNAFEIINNIIKGNHLFCLFYIFVYLVDGEKKGYFIQEKDNFEEFQITEKYIDYLVSLGRISKQDFYIKAIEDL